MTDPTSWQIPIKPPLGADPQPPPRPAKPSALVEGVGRLEALLRVVKVQNDEMIRLLRVIADRLEWYQS